VRDTVTVKSVETDTVIVQSVIRDTVVEVRANTVTVHDTVTVFSGAEKPRPSIKPWADIAEEARKSVYWLGVTTWQPNAPIVFIGTGFAVLSNALATNYHVSNAAQDIAEAVFGFGVDFAYVAIAADGNATERHMYYLHATPTIGAIGYWHPEYDLTVSSPDVMVSLFHPNETKQFESFVQLVGSKDAKELNVGDEIATLGYPGDLENLSRSRSSIRAIPTWKVGNISALRPYDSGNRTVNPMGRVANRIVQHDFNVSPGTSGSPIFNRRGEVVAVNNAVSTTEASLGFGIRADELRNILQAVAVENDIELINAEKPALKRNPAP
jgi:hypothetical protein